MEEYIIEYGKMPLFPEVRRDAERHVGRLPKSTRAIYYVTVSRRIGPRQWGELRDVGKFTIRKEQMDVFIKKFKRDFPSAKVQSLGY